MACFYKKLWRCSKFNDSTITKHAHSCIIAGAGLIGLGMAEAFKKRGQTGRRGDMMDVIVVEMADHILPTMLDTQRHWNIFTGHRHNKRTSKELSADLYITVEIVTGEVVDLIYQIKPLEFFGHCYWVNDHRQNARVIDTIIRNTRSGDKLMAHYQKAEKLSLELAMKKLEELTPLARNPKVRRDCYPSAYLTSQFT